MLEGVAHLHAAATVFLTGLIWFVQIVHYPLFAQVGTEGYPAYQRAHELRTTWVVAPAMLAELLSAAALAFVGWETLPRFLLVAGLALLGAIWLSTALLQVPRHRILESGFDTAAHRVLTGSNWVRTVAWTARAGIALALLHDAIRARVP